MATAAPAAAAVDAESRLAAGEGGVTTAYANNDIALHRVENRTDAPAFTLHIYAPGLRKIKLFRECGEVSVCTVSAARPGEFTACCAPRFT